MVLWWALQLRNKEHTPHGGRGKQSDTDRLGDFNFTLSIDILLLLAVPAPRDTGGGRRLIKP